MGEKVVTCVRKLERLKLEMKSAEKEIYELKNLNLAPLPKDVGEKIFHFLKEDERKNVQIITGSSFVYDFNVPHWKKKEKRNFFSICRVSTTLQEDKESLGIQFRAAKKYVEEVGGELIMTAFDICSGSENEARLALQYVFLRMMPGSCLIVTDADRLYRNIQHFVTIMNDLQKENIEIFIINSGRSSLDDTEKFIMQIEAAFAEKLRIDNKKKVVAAIKDLKDSGKLVKYASYGWSNPGKNQPVIENPEQQEGIRKILAFRKKNPNLSLAKTAEEINKMNIPSKTGGIWYASSISNLLIREGGYKKGN